MLVPERFTLVSGVGRGQKKLTAFDNALVCSGISSYSLVRISSILPPGCALYEDVGLPSGAPVFSAYSHYETDKPGSIAACVGVAVPNSSDDHGIIMELSGFLAKEEVERQVREMLQESMTFRGIAIKETRIITSVVKNKQSDNFASVFAAVLLW